MEQIDGFSAVASELAAKLCFQGQPMGIRVRGSQLPHQFRCAGGYLLITSEDDFSWGYNWFWYLASALWVGLINPRHIPHARCLISLAALS
jgi:hypothetical protein